MNNKFLANISKYKQVGKGIQGPYEDSEENKTPLYSRSGSRKNNFTL